MSDFAARVLDVVRSIPRGEVATYGEVAALAGKPGAARVAGMVLAQSGGKVPWWRVVNAQGRLVPGHETEHERRLRTEGIAVAANGRVPMRMARATRRV